MIEFVFRPPIISFFIRFKRIFFSVMKVRFKKLKFCKLEMRFDDWNDPFLRLKSYWF
jgi:hypothetical protein